MAKSRICSKLGQCSSAYVILLVALHLHGSSNAIRIHSEYNVIDSAPIAYTILVSKDGQGNFTSVQAAINSVPSDNTKWVCIHVKPDIYTEQVVIQKDKPYIYLQGEDETKTVIQWSAGGDVSIDSTFSVFADNFVATHITFKNTFPDVLSRGNINTVDRRAPAVMVVGDKAAFYSCNLVSMQDTLFDRLGRHLFTSCYIEGAIDFIFGQGTSQFLDCTIYSKSSVLGKQPGWVTAQGRGSPSDPSAFVFVRGSLKGDGSTYLGRAYGLYSTVIFYQTLLDANVTPLGWDAWNHAGQEGMFTYVEEGCQGLGSDKSGRVKWMKSMTPNQLAPYIDTNTFINYDGWLNNQPSHT